LTFYKTKPGGPVDPNINCKGKPPKYDLGRLWNLRYSRAKAQASYRKEGWNFNSTSWYNLWIKSGVKDQVGKSATSYCMVRKDPTDSWSISNCIIISRSTHSQRSGREHFSHLSTKRIGGAYYKQKESVR